MDASISVNLKICSYNMYGFTNGLPMLYSLCKTYDIILVQEHWLTTKDLCKFNEIDCHFTSVGVSAMDKKIENGLLVGRPFGGTAILFKLSLFTHITFIESDVKDGRFVAIRYLYNSIDILIMNVYFPYFQPSPLYTIDCCDLVANLERIVNICPNSSIVIAGDFNFSCKELNAGYNIFKHLVDNYDLIFCESLNYIGKINYTYSHTSQANFSWIDHFFISNKLSNDKTTFEIIDSGANLSDHNPISINIVLNNTIPPNNLTNFPLPPKPIPSMRWDKADLTIITNSIIYNNNYYNSSFTLQSIITPSQLSCSNVAIIITIIL